MLPIFSIKNLPFGARPEVALEPKVCSESCNPPKVTRRSDFAGVAYSAVAVFSVRFCGGANNAYGCYLSTVQFC